MCLIHHPESSEGRIRCPVVLYSGEIVDVVPDSGGPHPAEGGEDPGQEEAVSRGGSGGVLGGFLGGSGGDDGVGTRDDITR